METFFNNFLANQQLDIMVSKSPYKEFVDFRVCNEIMNSKFPLKFLDLAHWLHADNIGKCKDLILSSYPIVNHAKMVFHLSL